MFINNKYIFSKTSEQGGLILCKKNKQRYYQIRNQRRGYSYKAHIVSLTLLILSFLLKILKYEIIGEWHTHLSNNVNPSKEDLENMIANKKIFEKELWILDIISVDGKHSNRIIL